AAPLLKSKQPFFSPCNLQQRWCEEWLPPSAPPLSRSGTVQFVFCSPGFRSLRLQFWFNRHHHRRSGGFRFAL
ncbi:hypothetical protein A2U01_0079762, partial [Trifolium medium]|nr:hypothetical protein [Trifolium medium]